MSLSETLFRSARVNFIAGIMLLMFPCASAHGQAKITPDTITDEHVTKAIDAIIADIYRRKEPRIFWDPRKVERGESIRQLGGYTALTVLALISAGESYQHPQLRGAIEYLEKFDMKGTYAISIRASVWARLPDRFLGNLEKDIVWLIDGFSPHTQGWDYIQNPRTKVFDNSIRQFGALALWEAAKRGGKIDRRYWQSIEDGLITTQHESGAWTYRNDSPISGSMTTAGLATLFVTQDFLHAGDSLKINRNSEAVPRRNILALERGLKWLDDNFSHTENPGLFREYYYYMYGVERVGLASGRKYFGERDWFRDGAVEIINRLCKWDDETDTMSVHQKIGGRGNAGKVRLRYLDFGLLFLSRGRVPVAINKLQINSMAWNNRPRDAANLAAWISDSSESAVNWQIADSATPPSQWLDAPLLYLASHEALPWLQKNTVAIKSYVREMRDYDQRRAAGELRPDAEPPVVHGLPMVSKIKRYLDAGGMLFAINESNSKRFGNSVTLMGQLMYPGYEWRTLPADHWAYTIHTPVKRRRPPLKGLSNGVRELIILSTAGDLSRNFQVPDEKKEVQFQTASNIYFYASEMDRPRPRLSDHAITPDAQLKPSKTYRVTRAMYQGNWNPEPLALELLNISLTKHRDMGLNISEHSLARIDAQDPRPPLVIVSGIDRHEFNEKEQLAIKSYIEAGGVMLFETAGGRGEFTLSAEEMAAKLFGQTIVSALRSVIITGEGLNEAPDLTRLDYRPFSLIEAFGARETSPRLRAMKFDGKPRLLFSREDLSQALLDQPVWGVSGYSPQSARNLMGNILEFSRVNMFVKN